MRTFSLALALACAGTALLEPVPTRAQASVDQRALEQLQTPQAAPEATRPAPTKPARPTRSRPAPRAATPRANAAPHPATPAPPAPPAPPQIQVPLGPPPPAVLLPPPVIVPTRPPAPPPPIPIAADAAGAAEHLPDGLRITFGDASAELNPATESALRTLAHTAPADASFTLAAFARGTPEDPSTPRRLSLARALAARSVLIAEGIASVRIYVKALGSGRGVEDGPADRVDVIVTGTNPQARSTP